MGRPTDTISGGGIGLVGPLLLRTAQAAGNRINMTTAFPPSDRSSGLFATRRRAVALIGGSALAAVGCGRDDARATQAGPQPAATGRVVTLSQLGVDRFSGRDQWKALSAAFATAAGDGLTILGDGDARYRHDGLLLLDGVSFDGRGCTLVALSNGPQAIKCIGRNWRIANFTHLGGADRRSSENDTNGLWVGDGMHHRAEDFMIDNVTIGSAAPGRGFAGAGYMLNEAYRGRITGAVVRDTLADGIHVTNRSSDLMFVRPLSERTGDDGFAVVSYRSQGRLCRNIHVTDGRCVEPVGRGFAVVGGLDVTYERIRVLRSSAAGAYLYGEGSYDTFGVENCRILGAHLTDCSTGRGLPADFSNAALIIGGRDGSDTVDGRQVTRGAADCLVRDPVIEGAGAACTAAISLHEHAVRPTIAGGTLRDIRANGSRRPNGIEIAGRDITVTRPTMTDIAGLPITVLGTASGACTVTAPVVDGADTGSFNTFCYIEAAPRLTRMTIERGRFGRGPQRLAVSMLPAGRLRLTGNQVNGRPAG